jgi:hypothetical protein
VPIGTVKDSHQCGFDGNEINIGEMAVDYVMGSGITFGAS